jgi:uncharacterized membrane protein
MKKLVLCSLFFVLCLISLPSPVYSQGQQKLSESEERVEAVVSEIKEEKNRNDGGVSRKYQKLEIIVTSGSKKGERIIVENGLVPVIGTVEYEKGDKVSVSVTRDPKGKNVYFITDHIRHNALYVIAGIFFFLTVLVGGLRGVYSILGLMVSFGIIFFVVLPLILTGYNPVMVAVLSSFVIIPLNFFLTHGLNKKTTSAVIGTMTALLITGALANFFVSFAHLTGFTSDEAIFLEKAKGGVFEMRGIVLAGIIIGALGVLDDITVSQSSIVFQLRKTAEGLGFWQIYKRAMEVGRDHIASMVNTLVLVYTGAAMPLLLLFVDNPKPFSEIINYEIIAEEIIRTLVVSSGLILAVPIVTLVAALISDKDFKRASKEIFTSLK